VIFAVGTEGAVLAIAFATAPSFARLTQTLAASVTGRDCRGPRPGWPGGPDAPAGTAHPPNIGEPLAGDATIGAGSALLAFAGLSFPRHRCVQAPSTTGGGCSPRG